MSTHINRILIDTAMQITSGTSTARDNIGMPLDSGAIYWDGNSTGIIKSYLTTETRSASVENTSLDGTTQLLIVNGPLERKDSSTGYSYSATSTDGNNLYPITTDNDIAVLHTPKNTICFAEHDIWLRKSPINISEPFDNVYGSGYGDRYVYRGAWYRAMYYHHDITDIHNTKYVWSIGEHGYCGRIGFGAPAYNSSSKDIEYGRTFLCVPGDACSSYVDTSYVVFDKDIEYLLPSRGGVLATYINTYDNALFKNYSKYINTATFIQSTTSISLGAYDISVGPLRIAFSGRTKSNPNINIHALSLPCKCSAEIQCSYLWASTGYATPDDESILKFVPTSTKESYTNLIRTDTDAYTYDKYDNDGYWHKICEFPGFYVSSDLTTYFRFIRGTLIIKDTSRTYELAFGITTAKTSSSVYKNDVFVTLKRA